MARTREEVEAGRRGAAQTASTGAAALAGERLDRADVRGLQRSAGNAAVARLLSGAARPALQRSPRSWQGDTANVVGLPPGKARTSFWPPVVARITEYAELDESDHDRRAAVLRSLEGAIRDWEENQKSNWYASDLDKRKQAAVTQLTRLIAEERLELQAAPQGPAAGNAPPQPQPQVAVPAPPAIPAAPVLPAQPQPPQRLYDKESVREGDSTANDKRSFNHFVEALERIGGLPAAPPHGPGATQQPLPSTAEAAAVRDILSDLGSGYGEYGPACREKLPAVVQRANAMGYNIARPDVQRTVSSITLHMVGFGYSTTVSTTKSEWGGFLKYDQMAK